MGWEPRGENAEWLKWTLERVKEVPYKVTTRWAFYALHDSNRAKYPKEFYKKFKDFTAKARKQYWGGWDPDTLADDTRAASNHYGNEYQSIKQFFEYQKYSRPKLDWLKYQDNIVFVCFEAKAMKSQFDYHLNDYRVNMWPFGGDASIPFKRSLAAALGDAEAAYPNKDLYVLYFGDYDPKGLEIPDNAMHDVRAWSGVDFDFVRLGINADHVEEYNLPDDETGKYQWEALNERAAESLISRVFDYYDKDALMMVKQRERKAGEIWESVVDDAIEKAKKILGDDEDDDDDEEDDE